MQISLPPGRGRRRTSAFAAAATTGLVAAALLTAGSSASARSKPDLTTMPAPEPAAQITQLSERGTTTGRTAIGGVGGQARAAAPQTVCQQGAKWLRLRFTDLSLRGRDTVTVSGVAGGTFTFTGRHWPGKAFHTRAFAGECVQISPSLTDPASSYRIDAYQSGSQSLAAANVIVAAAGDICGTACNQTDDVVAAINPTAVITAGDNAYDSGTLSEFNNNYHPHWGKFNNLVRPSPGNHEYRTSGAAGYFDYYNGHGVETGARDQGYYSFDVGDWHFISLNSNVSVSASSPQVTWLRNDLAANTKPCTAAYWHHPRFSSGDHGDNSGMGALYSALYDAKTDLIINGHDHHYERFAPARPDGTRDDANGVRQFVIGTGGRALYSATTSSAGPSEVFNNNTFGVGKMTLTATGYTVEFVPVAGRTFTDRVTGTCRKASTSPDFGVTTDPTAVTVKQGNSASTSVRVSSSGGFSAATALSVSGLPAGVTATLSPASVTPPANGSATSTLTLTASSSAAVGTSTATISATSGAVTRTANLQVTVTGGNTVFADDFESDGGWTVNPAGTDTATSGRFERGNPDQTVSTHSNQIKQLGTTTSGVNCLVTGAAAGSAYGANDLDGGVTSIRSSAVALPSGASTMAFAYSVGHGDNSGPDDYLRVRVVDGSTVTTVFEKVGAAAEVEAIWQNATVDLSAYAGRTVRIQVEAADAGTASLFEAQVDDLEITSAGTGQADFAVTANPTAVIIPQGQKNYTTVNVASINGFGSAVDLNVTGAPAGVQTQWQSDPVTPPAGGSVSSQLMINTTATTATGTFDLTVTGTAGALSHAVTVRVTVTSAGAGGFADDFESDRGWTVNPAGTDTATSGRFERGNPDQTVSTHSNQVKQLGTTTSGVNCLVTGAAAGSAYGANDLDGGVTSIRSPQIVVPAGTARLTFAYSVGHGDNSGPDDYLRVRVVDGSTVTTVFEKVGAAAEVEAIWQNATVDLSAYAGRTVRIQVEAADAGTASLFEAQVDDLSVTN
ncbi:hypothetical protein GCM10027290_31160 [Micromonospora sonneratiae]